MSKLLAALIGAVVAVGVAYVIWRVHKQRVRTAKDETMTALTLLRRVGLA